jgi:D-tyrosyl-tRNA(Tyr) deacylase
VKAVVQRVRSASVAVDGREVSSIGPGMLVLLGVADGDGRAQAEKMAGRLTRLRIFSDAEGRMNEALREREILCVSQFTLIADTSGGNRPGFSDAARPDVAEPLYDSVCELTGAAKGVFGADMLVRMEGDGPVTLLLET